jgi:hypothetical protein
MRAWLAPLDGRGVQVRDPPRAERPEVLGLPSLLSNGHRRYLSGQENVDLYLHALITLHGVVLN